MNDDDDSAEKIFEATPHKLEEARKRGELVRSTELATAAGYAGMVITGVTIGAASLQGIGETLAVLLGQADRLAPQMLGGGAAVSGGVFSGLALAGAPWFLIPMLAVFLTIVAQRALVFAPEKLEPKLSRVSVLANAKNKFGRDGLFEFGKSFVKLVVISGILWLFFISRLPLILGALALSPVMVTALLLQLLLEFLAIMLAVALAIGAVDYLWQYHQHLRKNRMTRKEMTDEMKNSEGDPHVKQQRRQRGYDIATNRMLADVPKADVVIVNPTHYAVALKWTRADRGAPVCVAKGVDEIAARIREMAAEAGIPLRSDPPTARALYATVEVGQEIGRDQYRAVAAAIRFAEAMRARARERRGW
ncbi:flagellar biosynthetic protein FlhB [Rhodobacteraceae bacterium MBR-64]|jgi:flagellar biosynthetic protein FlhB